MPKGYGGVNRGISLQAIGTGFHERHLAHFSSHHNWASHTTQPWEVQDRNCPAQGTHSRKPVSATVLTRGPQSSSSCLAKSEVHKGVSPSDVPIGLLGEEGGWSPLGSWPGAW